MKRSKEEIVVWVIGFVVLLVFLLSMNYSKKSKISSAEATTTQSEFLDIITTKQYEGSTRYTRLYDTKYNVVCYGISQYDKIPDQLSCVKINE